MRLTPFLSREQVETIHRNALRVLSEVGVRVEHAELRGRLTAVGGRADEAADVVRFPAPAVERHIAQAPKRPLPTGPARIGEHAGIYQCSYLDPDRDELVPFDEDRLARFAALARSRPRIQSVAILGAPFVPTGIPPAYLPLLEKLFGWKYGLDVAGSVQLTGLCQPLLDMFACHASATGRELGDVFAATGYLVSPLRLARSECEQVLFFAERGFRMHLGAMQSQGGSAPVSFAGALVLCLAERIFLFLTTQCLWGEAEFHVGGSIPTMEFRTGVTRYGRPEQQRANVALADLARFYGCSASGHAGLTDALLPSYEAGIQKATGALICALATGHGSVEAGILGMDTILSPVQLVLDDDLVGGLQALLAEPVVDDVECAFDEIRAAGPGGHHLGTEHTARRYRRDIYQPETWSDQLLESWRCSGKRTDAAKARDIVADHDRRFTHTTFISSDEERELRAIIGRAVGLALAGNA